MKATVTATNHRWMRRALVLTVLLSGLSAAPGKAEDNHWGNGGELCRLGGGTYTDLGGGTSRCCLSDWGCIFCDNTGCFIECQTRRCCQMNRVPGKATCSVLLGLVAGDLEPDDGSGDGLIDGDFIDLAGLPVLESMPDASGEMLPGSIIIVDGRVGEVLDDGTVLVPVDPPAPDTAFGQLELMLAAMQEDQADLDESDADSSVDADDEDSARDGGSTDGSPDGGAVQEAGDDAAAPIRAEEEREGRRAPRRGRARR
jgi:hypothetical protein